MNVAVINVMVPFVYGDAEFLADSLCKKIQEFGHSAQVIRFHYSHFPAEHILDGIFAARAMRLENMDSVIALKFPAYLIPHPNKRLWLVHQLREAYDLEDTEYDFFAKTANDVMVKAAIRECDNKCFKELEGKIYAISKAASDRLMKYNGISSQVLYPPLPDEEIYSAQAYGDYIFYPSRLSRSKRQHLAVEAMRHVKSNVKLVLAGRGDSKEDESLIFGLIEKWQLGDKVTFINRSISQEERAKLYQDALGVIYIPFDEESFSYVPLEAFQSEKPVIAATDSGDAEILIKDGITGLVAPPDAKSLAEAMDRLYLNKRKAQEMGMNGLLLLRELNISWANVIEKLVES